jgi:hypothetical protein
LGKKQGGFSHNNIMKSMKTITGTELFTQNILYVKIYRFIINSYFFNQRYRLAIPQELNADFIVLLLNDFFPGLVFVPKNSGDITIANYITQKHGKWTLDVNALSKSKEKIFSSLFPENISGWNEAEARKKYGCADLIRFFIDTENDAFSSEFSKSGKSAMNRGESIPKRFFDELDYSGKPVWQDWDFSALVIHKMRRRPPNIYEAFGYYAHRRYTLMGFGASHGNSDDELLKSGTGTLNNTICEKIPETADWGVDRLTPFFEMIQETLESVPADSSIYVPTALDVFIKQLKMKISNLYKNHGYEEETYSAADRKTINNHIRKAKKYAADRKILYELRNVQLTGTYREKINLLHSIVLSKLPAQYYSQRERDIIHGLFLKQHRRVSLDMALGGDEEDNAFTGYDLVGDNKNISAEDHLAWSSFFRDEFVKEVGKDSLEKFIECLPDHFSRFPFDTDCEGNLSMSKYSRKMLFFFFFLSAGIPADNELRGLFMVLLKRVVDSINKGRVG